MHSFASVQAFVAQPFFDAAPMSLSKIERLAEDVGLPGSLISQPKGIISLHAAEKFMVQLDRCINHPTYFMESLKTPEATKETSVANIAFPRAITGIEAVEMVAKRISSILYGAGFLTERDGSRVWLLRTAGTTEFTDYWPVQQYNLEVGLQAVRRVLGRKVDPCGLRLSCHVPRASLPDVWRHLPLNYSPRTMGIAFQLDDLLSHDRRVVVSQPGHGLQGTTQEADAVSMRACLETYLNHTAPECLSDSMAKAFGMSGRSYRRHLESIGVSHRQLVSDARLSKAEVLLSDPEIPITEISFELGYTNSPAFTRFFKARTGTTPQEYRRKRLS